VKTDVARQLRRIEEVGGFELKFTNDLSVSELLQAAADIHTKRQNELGRESLFERPNERAFVEEICALYKQRGWLDYIVLIMHGRIAAYELGFLYGGVRYGWIMGFDPEYHKLSLGKVLTYHWIEDAFRRKEIVEFNFMRGDSEYKRKFTDHYRSNHHFIVRHPNSLYVRGIGLAERVLKSRG
jgi:CelD/BcsL family acetyltransferase involved in cellulose biosynthesis